MQAVMNKYLISLLVLLFGTTVIAQNKAQWRGEKRDGIYHETNLLKQWPVDGPNLLWHYDELGPGHASATVTDNMIFTAGTEGENGFIIAFDHAGKTIWKKIYGKEWVESWDGVRSTPIFYNDQLYIMNGYGEIFCLNAKDGSQTWMVDVMKDYDGRNIKWGVTENLVIEDNMLFCTAGGKDANVIALDAANGNLIWKNNGKGEKSAYCSPNVINHKGRKILVTNTESSILGIDIKSGKLLWTHHQPNQYSVHANTPLYHNGDLYIVSGYGKGGVMLQLSEDGTKITEKWRNSTLDNKMGGVILHEGIIYGSGDYSRKWISLDWNTGQQIAEDSFIKKGNIIFADGMLYCYGQDGKIALVKPNKGEFNVISKFKVPYGEDQHWAHLVIHNKKLYVRHGESLMVFGLSIDDD